MKTIDPTKYTAHQHPGKFEGETAATEYFYEQMLNGDGETIIYPLADGPDDISEDSPTAQLFRINAEEAEAFTRCKGLVKMPIGHWFLLREDSQGFVYGTVHATREQAEQKFQSWVA